MIPARPRPPHPCTLTPLSPPWERVGERGSASARRMSRYLRPLVLSLPIVAALFAVAPPPAAAAMTVQEVVSPGGIRAWLIEDHANPILSLSLEFRGGSVTDPPGKEGRAEFVSAMLDEGAGDLDSTAFQQQLADLAVDLSFGSGQDSFGGQLRTLTEHRDAAFDLLRLALTRPRFDEGPLERIRGQLLARLAGEVHDPDALAGRTWRRVIFAGHPYGRPGDGTVEGVKAVTGADLASFAAERFARDNLLIAIVGDIGAAELAPLLDSTFGGLAAKAAPVAATRTAPSAAGQVIVVDKDIPQSVMLFGHEGIPRHDPDFYAAYLVNYMLGGGGFSSRLTNEVREKRGLAYSIDTNLLAMDYAELIMGSVGTQNARVAETLALVREEWARMREDGPGVRELADAKTYVIGSYALRFSSTAGIARMLTGLQLDGFGPDYLTERNGYFAAVTHADAVRVAKRLLDPAKLTVIVVGRPEGVVPTAPAPKDNM